MCTVVWFSLVGRPLYILIMSEEDEEKEESAWERGKGVWGEIGMERGEWGEGHPLYM